MSTQGCHSPASSSKRGRSDSSLHVDYPILNTLDNGSDTEEEDNTEMEEYYLNRANKKRSIDIVFGEAIGIQKLREGTVYTHVEERTVDGEVSVSQKQRHRQELSVSSSKCHSTPISAQIFQDWTPSPCNAKESSTTAMLPNSLVLPSRPIKSPPSTSVLVYDTCTPDKTLFQHSSAGVDLRSAYIRPFSQVLHNSKVLPLPLADWLPPPSQQMPHQLLVQTFQPSDQIGDMLATKQGARRVVSGSFGSFQDQPGRFDERPYQLLPGKGTKEKERERWVREIDGGKRRVYHNGGLNPLKARPWLRK